MTAPNNATFEVDVSFRSNRKFVDLAKGPAEDAAIALWVKAGAWVKDNAKRGRVPLTVAHSLGTDIAIAELVRVGLWIAESTGYRFHDWSDYQKAPSKRTTPKPKQLALLDPGPKSTPPVTKTVLKEYERLHKERFGTTPAKSPALFRSAMVIGAWCSDNAAAQKLFPEALVTALLEAFFASECAAREGFTLPFLATNPMRYLQPTKPKPAKRGPAPVHSEDEYAKAAAGGDLNF